MTEIKTPQSFGHPPLTGGHKKKILITGGRGMLAYDFVRTQHEKFEIIAVDRDACDITSFESVMQCISMHEPDILLNCAAYTAVDDAEDIGMKVCFDVNTLGVHNLARATAAFGIAFITISTDYVFDGKKEAGYLPSDECNPIGAYGMSKYLGEKLAIQANPRSIIVRTSWLYGGIAPLSRGDVTQGQGGFVGEKGSQTPINLPLTGGIGTFNNFVNTMLRLSETRSELTVVNDQHGIPTSCVDLSFAISELIDRLDDFLDEGKRIFHFSSACSSQPPGEGGQGGSVSWADFAREIFQIAGQETRVINCSSSKYPTKARRPSYSILVNDSDISLPDWKIGLTKYLAGK